MIPERATPSEGHTFSFLRTAIGDNSVRAAVSG